MGSKRFSLDLNDLKKVAIGAGVAAAGAGLTYLGEWVQGTDFGVWTPMVVTASAIVVNAFRKWAANYAKAE